LAARVFEEDMNKGRRFVHSAAALAGVFLASVCALSPCSVEARDPRAASYWDVSGDWALSQSNHIVVSLHLEQPEDNTTIIHGRASYSASDGQVEGTLNGTNLHMQIYWKVGEIGVYDGKIDARGMIEGTTHGKVYSIIKATWFSSRPMKWSPWPGDVTHLGGAATPATRPPGVRMTGHRVLPAAAANPAGPAAAPSALGTPAITASPSFVTIPAGQTQGTTTLTWDAGSSHAYAEVWVKVDDQEETFVVEKGKGTRQVTVRPGKTYLYILTDSGQRLATVTVKAQ
jgi:hypothetical protein